MPQFTVTSNTNDSGILATSVDGEGIRAESRSATANTILAIQRNADPTTSGAAVHAECEGGGHAISGIQKNPHPSNPEAAGIYGEHISGGLAGFFRGNVIVHGDISFPGGNDLAEHFTIEVGADAEPGTVMALSCSGALVPTATAYERKVVGVVAGAGSFRPGILLDKQEHTDARRQPIALVGKVYCKADARYGPIDIGDLLTSSETLGHAMRASDPDRAFGAVIGKAMAPLAAGIGLIPAVIALQ